MSSRISDTGSIKILDFISEINGTVPSTGNYQIDDRYSDPVLNQTTISSLVAENITRPISETLLETHNQLSAQRNATELIPSSSVHLSSSSTEDHMTSMGLTSNLTGPSSIAATENMSGQSNTTPSESEPWFEMPPMENITDLISIVCSGAMIIGGLVPYIPQYLKIKRSGSSEGFSTYVCLTLLIANILRIAFWLGHRFEMPLLVQSFVMIAGMVAMMELCVRVRTRNVPHVIGVRSPASRPRRSLIGKILPATNDDPTDVPSGLHNESTPIYSVNGESRASSSTSSNITTTNTSSASKSKLAGSASALHNSAEPQTSSYHLQESIQIENERMDDVNLHAQPFTQYNSNKIDSFSNLESPILSNIQQSTSVTSQDTQHGQQGNGTESQPSDHSYSNGFISHQRKYRPGLVKSLASGRFWDWDDLLSYFKFIALFTVILGLITYLLLDNYYYVEALGYAAGFSESMLGVPQLMRNCIHKSTQGMSVEMVILWLSGDVFKTLYYILRKTPVQLIVCGAIQVTVDVLILVQVFWYARPKVNYSKLPKST